MTSGTAFSQSSGSTKSPRRVRHQARWRKAETALLLILQLALRGVTYRAMGAASILRRNLLIYGLGGVILPFIGIKLIDLVVHNLFGA